MITIYLEAKFHETLMLQCQFSQIRLLRLGLAIISFTKVLIIFSKFTSNPGVRATAILAIVYMLSYFILKILTWTLVEFPGHRLLHDIPHEDLLPIVRYVDPGNNPFTFPPPVLANNTEIQLNDLATQGIADMEMRKYPWN